SARCSRRSSSRPRSPGSGPAWPTCPPSPVIRSSRRTRTSSSRDAERGGDVNRFALIVALLPCLIAALTVPAAAAAAGQIPIAIHGTLAPTWFDPAETPGVVTPFLPLYALHDALVKPMPGNPFTPGLAESWTASKDGLAYEFVLRRGVRFH